MSAMPASERKRLIAKAKENSQIAKAIAEEKAIIANTPIHMMPKDERLAHLPKYADPKKPGEECAVEVINARREKVVRGVALMASEIEKEAKPEKEKPKEKPKPRGRSKKVK